MLNQYKQLEEMVHSEFPDIVISSRIIHKRAPGSANLHLHFQILYNNVIYFAEVASGFNDVDEL